ncbi:hypothetical protein AB6A40_006643 [Gnathostoma spinigerum]|uniref:Guanylate kinase-like domain-containing protein n=1 Tax=Gnathostoma spinigerum TaxID=75299 RepID=A0ABD6EIZ1_9BILA
MHLWLRTFLSLLKDFRSHETDGFDYHFAKRTDMEIWIRDGRFLEYGEYKGNLYGTLTDSVVSVMQQGRVPVLNPHPLALRVLRNNRFKPFIIFVKSPELKILKETRTRALNLCDTRSASLQTISSHPRTFTDFELEQIVSTSNHLFRLYGQYADVIIVNTVLEKAFSQLSHALHLAETKSVWVPSSWTEISLLPQCQSKGAV